MKVLFITISKIRGLARGDIYEDIMEEFAGHGQEVYVLSPVERKENIKLEYQNEGYLHYYYVKIGNYYKTDWIRKGVTTVLLTSHYIKKIKKELKTVKPDIVLYATPPVTFFGVIKYVKKIYPDCISYLMLKDIWPQAMADMGILNNTGLSRILYGYFRRQEKALYQISDYIGCMSPANEKYLYGHNRYLKKDCIEICPNAVKVKPGDGLLLSGKEKGDIRKKNNLPLDKLIFVYGGNIGNGHDVDFIIKCLKKHESREDSFMLFVGKGIYYDRLESAFVHNKFHKAKLIPFLPHEEYMELLKACDVGLIFLDHKFTIPNFPSKLLSYLRIKMPVLIASDTASDIGPVAEKAGFGYWCESDDEEKVMNLMVKYRDESKRKKMGEKGFCFMKKYFSTETVYNQIMKHIL